MTKQRGFTVVTRIVDGKVEELGRLLDDIGDDINENAHLRLGDVSGLHYASFVIVDVGTTPSLLFEGNIDGGIKQFFTRIVDTRPKAVDAIYSDCVGYPSEGTTDAAAVVQYLIAHDIGIHAFYVAWPQQSLKEICEEQQLRDRLEEFLDEELRRGTFEGLSANAIRWRAQALVTNDPSLAWAQTRRPRPFLVRRGDRVVQLLVAGLAAGLGATIWRAIKGRRRSARYRSRLVLLATMMSAAGTALMLHRAERSDNKNDSQRTEDWQSTYARWSANLGGIVQRENVQGQNHLASVSEIKHSRFRFALLRTVLFAVNLAALLTANKGSLGGISSIHFARWVITPDRRHLIFLSNFDGSWERYLNDFIDLASKGLTAVWTNTTNEIGFPKTRRLLWDGARDEQRFKSYSRYSQARTRTWYSAYPNLSNDNIANNAVIRDLLFADLTESEAKTWLHRL